MPHEFSYYTGLEPRLLRLEAVARRLATRPLSDAQFLSLWYGRFKPRIVRLVGYGRKLPGTPAMECVPEPGEGIVLVSGTELLAAYARQLTAKAVIAARTDPEALRRHRELETTEAYTVVYQHLLKILESAPRHESEEST